MPDTAGLLPQDLFLCQLRAWAQADRRPLPPPQPRSQLSAALPPLHPTPSPSPRSLEAAVQAAVHPSTPGVDPRGQGPSFAGTSAPLASLALEDSPSQLQRLLLPQVQTSGHKSWNLAWLHISGPAPGRPPAALPEPLPCVGGLQASASPCELTGPSALLVMTALPTHRGRQRHVLPPPPPTQGPSLPAPAHSMGPWWVGPLPPAHSPCPPGSFFLSMALNFPSRAPASLPHGMRPQQAEVLQHTLCPLFLARGL